MKEFFSSARFKILLGIAIVLAAFLLRAAWTGGVGTVTSSLIGVVTSPIQKVSAGISDRVADFLGTFAHASDLRKENEELKQEIKILTEKLVDYDSIKHANEVYEKFWEIKKRPQNMEIVPASVIGRDASDRFYSFTIDCGSRDGIQPRSTVITDQGMVGIVSEVGLISSKVTTILDPANNIGVYDTRTRDTGLATGTVDFSERGLCKMSYIPRESVAAVGDLVVTSGISGKYPKDQVIGKIKEVHMENHGSSLYAVIEPSANIQTVKDVLVIKSFAGQGGEVPAPGKEKTDTPIKAPEEASSVASGESMP